MSDIAAMNDLFDYLKSEFILQSLLQSYESQSPRDRFKGELALDLYRQCCERLHLRTGLRLMKDDAPLLMTQNMSPHHRESFYDIFYEISMRSVRVDQAIDFLKAAFNTKRTAARAEGLINAFIAADTAEKAQPYLDYLRSADVRGGRGFSDQLLRWIA